MSSVLALKASPQSAIVFPDREPKSPPALAGEPVLLPLVARLAGGEHAQGVPGLAGAALQRFHVLGKARAAEAGAGVQELVAEAGVRADAAPHFLDVGADRLGE